MIRIPVGPSGRPAAWALVDEDRYEDIVAFRWYMGGRGYPFVPKDQSPTGRSLTMHRFVIGAHHGDDSDHVVDHINRDKLDNRRENLRLITQRENALNSSIGDKVAELAPRARELRGEGWLLNDIAEELGVSVTALVKWCRGIPRPPHPSLIWTPDAIADALRDFHTMHGRLPRQYELNGKDGLPWFTTIYRVFPGGIKEAREYAGFGAVDCRAKGERLPRRAA